MSLLDFVLLFFFSALLSTYLESILVLYALLAFEMKERHCNVDEMRTATNLCSK